MSDTESFEKVGQDSVGDRYLYSDDGSEQEDPGDYVNDHADPPQEHKVEVIFPKDLLEHKETCTSKYKTEQEEEGDKNKPVAKVCEKVPSDRASTAGTTQPNPDETQGPEIQKEQDPEEYYVDVRKKRRTSCNGSSDSSWVTSVNDVTSIHSKDSSWTLTPKSTLHSEEAAAADDGLDGSHSTASSFVPVHRLTKLKIHKGNDPDEAVARSSFAEAPSSEWSSSYGGDSSYTVPLPSNQWERDDISQSTTTTVISGFECLDIGGFEMRRCKADSFLNKAGAIWCEGCGVALVANPCPDLDHQIALNLQRKEEKDALSELQENERKRKYMHEQPLLKQAQTVVAELITHVEFNFPYVGTNRSTAAPALRCRRFGINQDSAILLKAGYSLVSEVDLSLSMARFLTYFGEQNKRTRIQLGFTFSSKYGDMRRMAQGERSQVKVVLGTNNKDAIKDAFGRWKSIGHSEEPSQSTESHSNKPYFSFLSRISEEDELNVDDAELSAVGWIVAIVRDEYTRVDDIMKTSFSQKTDPPAEQKQTQRQGKHEGNPTSSYFEVATLTTPGSYLPLVCFDASSRDDPETKRLFNAVERIILDLMSYTTTAGSQVHCQQERNLQRNNEDNNFARPTGDIPTPNGNTFSERLSEGETTSASESLKSNKTSSSDEINRQGTSNGDTAESSTGGDKNTSKVDRTGQEGILESTFQQLNMTGTNNNDDGSNTVKEADRGSNDVAPLYEYEGNEIFQVEGLMVHYCLGCHDLVASFLPCPNGCFAESA